LSFAWFSPRRGLKGEFKGITGKGRALGAQEKTGEERRKAVSKKPTK